MFSRQMRPRSNEGDHEPALYRLDQLTVSLPLAQARQEVSGYCQSKEGRRILDVMAWWTPLFGYFDRPSVTVLNRIRSDEAFLEAFTDPDQTVGWRRPWRVRRSTRYQTSPHGPLVPVDMTGERVTKRHREEES